MPFFFYFGLFANIFWKQIENPCFHLCFASTWRRRRFSRAWPFFLYFGLFSKLFWKKLTIRVFTCVLLLHGAAGASLGVALFYFGLFSKIFWEKIENPLFHLCFAFTKCRRRFSW